MGLEMVTCPVCLSRFEAVTAYKGTEICCGTDLRPYYSGDNLLNYAVLQCMLCGYASLTEEFDLEIPDIHRDQLLRLLTEEILPLLNKHILEEQPIPLHVEFESAALISERLGEYGHQTARLWLMAAWAASDDVVLLEDQFRFRCNAVKHFRSALENLEVDLYDRAEICYLIGENLRRMGALKQAKKYFRLVSKEAVEKGDVPIVRLAKQQMRKPQEVLSINPRLRS